MDAQHSWRSCVANLGSPEDDTSDGEAKPGRCNLSGGVEVPKTLRYPTD